MDISSILELKGISKSELAERLGIHNQNVNKMLKNPTEASIIKIANALDIAVWRLFASPEEVINENNNESSGVCPHCGKPITIKIS